MTYEGNLCEIILNLDYSLVQMTFKDFWWPFCSVAHILLYNCVEHCCGGVHM